MALGPFQMPGSSINGPMTLFFSSLYILVFTEHIKCLTSPQCKHPYSAGVEDRPFFLPVRPVQSDMPQDKCPGRDLCAMPNPGVELELSRKRPLRLSFCTGWGQKPLTAILLGSDSEGAEKKWVELWNKQEGGTPSAMARQGFHDDSVN